PWRGTLLGFIVLGPLSSGDYTTEDFEFLRTVGEQAASSIMAVRLADAPQQLNPGGPGRTRTPALIHDSKKTGSALSLLADNAAKHLAEPEFQRDALITLSRTVERMRRLLGKLAATTPERPGRCELIDLHDLIVEATSPLANDGKVQVVRRLRPVTPV